MAKSDITIGSVVSSKTFGKTNAEVSQILTWFMKDKIGPDPEGMTVAQLNLWRLDQAHEEMWRYVQREARKNRLVELKAAQADLDAQATSDVAL